MSIIFSSIKRSLRDKNSLLSNLMLVLVLPFIFSMMYDTDLEKESINLNIKGNVNSQITKSYIEFMEDFDKENENIELNVILNESKNTSDVVIEIDEKNKSITFIGNKTMNIAENIVAGASEEFFNILSMQEVIYKSGNMDTVSNNNIIKNTVYKNNEETLNYEAYFAITMLEMATLVGSIFAFRNTFYIKENIGNRAKTSSIRISKLMTLELIGSFIIIFLQSIVILISSSVLYGVNINLNNIIPIILVLAVLSILAVSIGILCSAISNKRSWGENIVSLLVTAITLASGTLMPNWDMNGTVITNINPFKWIHQSIFSLVENGSAQNLNLSLGMTIGCSIIIMIIATFILNRKVVD